MLSVSVEFIGLQSIRSRLEKYPGAINEELHSAVVKATEAVYRQAKDNISKTFKTSAKMQNALQMTVEKIGTGDFVRGSVSISGVGYVTQEFGGRKAYDIFPRNAPALAFPGSLSALFRNSYGTRQGKSISTVFAARVHREPLPERSFLRLAMNQKRAEITAAFQAIGAKAWGSVD